MARCRRRRGQSSSTRHSFAFASCSTSTMHSSCRRASFRSHPRSRGPMWARSEWRSLRGPRRHGGGVRRTRGHVARRLLDTYPGPLLGTEEHAWIAKPRDALRARFVRTLARLGERLEHAGDCDRHRRLAGAASKPTTSRSRFIAAHARARLTGDQAGAQRVPPLPRTAVDRAGRQAIRRNESPVAGNRGRPHPASLS